ncbi:MAG TPA: D-aminoacylase [Longimicrobiales bacterium]|nr:D-aminoacylase [Longimicrobiales bacterium]
MKRRTFVRTAGLAIGAAGTGALAPGALFGALGSPRRADLVLRGALVFDGLGTPPVEADVAITADRVAAVGPGLSAAGALEVDLRGLALAPGFVDLHSHTDGTILTDPLAPSKVRQGVTTEIAGADGGSIGPWSEEEFRVRRERYRESTSLEIDFRDLGGFLRFIDRLRPAPNLASMVGAGSVRAFVMGDDDRPPTDAELARMVAEVERAVRDGACGVSSGLEYTPGGFADLDELVALAAVLGGTGLSYASHMRNEDDRLLAAVEEAINVGRFAGVPVEISHLKAQGARNWWKAGPVLHAIERAREDGVDVRFDVYPYIAYSTGLANLFPLSARDGGDAAFRARLADPEEGPRLEAAVRAKVASLGSWDAVQVTSTADEALTWARGRRLGELARERGEDPYALLVRIMAAGGGGMVGFGMSEENVARMLAHPLAVVVSDASARATEGPLSSGSPHPRAYGTFPRVLGRYVRELGVLPLETAIRKMTSMPADRAGLGDRGRVRPGAFADLVAFDPDVVADRATFEDPHRYPVGIPHVIVNGRFVLRDGEPTAERPGRALRPGAR